MSERRKLEPRLEGALFLERRRQRESQGRNGAAPKGGPMRILNLFPLLTIPVVVYNLMTLLGNSNLSFVERLNGVLWSLPMASGAVWVVTPGDVLILIALVLLFVELIKATHTGTSAIINHGLSLILFIVCLIEFLLIKNFATSVFFAIMIMALLDTLAGVIVTITSARRDFSVTEE
jgi:hypothetical protein